jgi:hypothetical protein
MAYKKRTKRTVTETIPEEQDMMEDFSYDDQETSGGIVKLIISILIIAIILVGGWYAIGKYTNINLPGMSSSESAPSGWHAIFLSNGQVYFGQIDNIDGHDLILSDIYYLQVVDQPLQQSQGSDEVIDPANPKQGLTLAKLGGELHGPTDRMVINRDHIMLTEELKADSNVVVAINAYKEELAK